MIQAVLFDMGGVLFTSETDEAWHVSFSAGLMELMGTRGMGLPGTPEEFSAKLRIRAEEYKAHSEMVKYELPVYRIWKEYYLADYSVPEEALKASAEELSLFYDNGLTRHIRRPHLAETMEELDRMGLRQGIISNIISRTFVPQLVREYGIDRYMEIITQSSEAGYRKPDPRIFEITLTRMGIHKEECAYVGDTISRDVIGARSAQLGLVIQIPSDASARRDGPYRELGYKPDYLISDLNQLPGILRERNGI